MKAEKRKKAAVMVFAMAVTVGIVVCTPVRVKAAQKFDPLFYASAYPDVGMAVGVDENALYYHYITCGRAEGRIPCAGAAGGEEVDGITDTSDLTGLPAMSLPGVVPLKDLAHYTDIRDAMTDEELTVLYNVLAPVMQELQAELSQYEQVYFLKSVFTDMYATGEVTYSASTPHFSNPRGFFGFKSADSSGCARALGLQFSMLGMEWEHVGLRYGSEVVYHWCVVTIDGQRYVVDPYRNIFSPEESRYYHPVAGYALEQIYFGD